MSDALCEQPAIPAGLGDEPQFLFLDRNDRHEIRFRQITIIVRRFLRPHRQSNALGIIPGTGFLDDVSAIVQYFLLTLDFVFKRTFNCLEGIDVFISALVPSAVVPSGRETLTSARRFPSSILQLETSMYSRIDLTFFTYSGLPLPRKYPVPIRFQSTARRSDCNRHWMWMSPNGIAGMNELTGILFHMNARNAYAFVFPLTSISTPACSAIGKIVQVCRKFFSESDNNNFCGQIY